MNGIEADDLALVAKQGAFEDVSKLAIEYSDAVIQGSESINESVLDYAKKSQKLFLPYQDPQNYVSSYNQFYDQILGE
jgi:starch synthase